MFMSAITIDTTHRTKIKDVFSKITKYNIKESKIYYFSNYYK